MRGTVNPRREAVMRLRVRGPGGAELEVDAIVDTGYSGSLTLPTGVVTSLALARQSGGSAVMADGSLRAFDVYAADVIWDGSARPVLVATVGNEALLGMRLLAGHELRIEAEPGGVVEIRPLP